LRALVKRIVIRVSVPGLENSTIEALKAVLDKHPGECPVQFELVTPAAYKVEAQSAEVQSVEYSDTLVKEIRDLLGDDSVQVEY
jgi:hypothetical protein